MDISLIEFIVYGLIGYTGVVLLIISAFRETPTGKAQSIVRAMYLTLSMIAIIILAGSGVDIILEDKTITLNATSNYEVLDNTNAIVVLNSTVIQTDTSTSVSTLQNPIWILFHFMLAIVMLVYIILQILILLTKI